MGSRTTIVPRSSVFTLEDGTWVVQRSVDRVQELLTGQERSFSSMDISFEISDPELDILVAQSVIHQYDEFFIWLDRALTDKSTQDNSVEGLTFYYVSIALEVSQIDLVRARLEEAGLTDRYEAAERNGHIAIMRLHEEPFIRLGHAEDAQTLLMPFMQSLETQLAIEQVSFDSSSLPAIWPEPLPPSDTLPLIRRSAPEIKAKSVICIDNERRTHQLVSQISEELGAILVSAYTGKDGTTLIQDADPALIVMDLKLPDMHGYEIVAYVRNNPELAHIPIVIVSTLDSEADRALAFTVAEAKDYIVKPLNTNELRRRIWRELNQNTV
ncbi:MAG: response regulator [Chloroflexi bacterium]|nr:response regulator [Chloroflexota bacterium]